MNRAQSGGDRSMRKNAFEFQRVPFALPSRLIATRATSILLIALAGGIGLCHAAENPQDTTFESVDPASVGFSPTRLALLNTTMHRAVDNGQVAGVQTLLVRHGKLVSTDTYGTATSPRLPCCRGTRFFASTRKRNRLRRLR